MKRAPTLADRFSAYVPTQHERIIRSDVIEKLRNRVRTARRFVFDDAAAYQIGRVISAIPELLVREQQFARAPFDLMWIEYPHWKFWRALYEDDDFHLRSQDQHSDHTVGYLIDHNQVTVIAGGTLAEPLHYPTIVPVQYTLHTEWLLQEQITFAERTRMSRIQIDDFLWGSARIDLEHRRLLRSQHRCDVLPFDQRFAHGRDDFVINASLSSSVGELRTIITMLLMLNRPSITRYRNDVPATRGWLKNKLIPFHSHTTVSIDLNAVETLKLVGTPAGEAVPRRRHEVWGHYCHDKNARDFLRLAGCQHDWLRTTDDWTPWPDAPHDEPGHWVCQTCSGKRWWRHKHERGDATRGYVTHDYEVTA